MGDERTHIIVLTPVKNEGWILRRFLSVTSCFADNIIVADQNSTDESVAICAEFPKVHLIRNENVEYSEAQRQLLLINTARKLYRGRTLLLALDADEILAANALETSGWQTMLRAAPGSALYFEKVTLIGDGSDCIRSHPLLLGCIDDGLEHQPRRIHSERLPRSDHCPEIRIHDVKILDYQLMRPEGQLSKTRFYAVVENVHGTLHLIGRRRVYDPASILKRLRETSEESRPEWFKNWTDLGIDMLSIVCSRYYWYEFHILKQFKAYGVRRFWFDKIWAFDWESVRQYAAKSGLPDVPINPIKAPPLLLVKGLNIMDAFARVLRSWRQG
jgi:glycosyltransferase involved in cell wall biosynthesis